MSFDFQMVSTRFGTRSFPIEADDVRIIRRSRTDPLRRKRHRLSLSPGLLLLQLYRPSDSNLFVSHPSTFSWSLYTRTHTRNRRLLSREIARAPSQGILSPKRERERQRAWKISASLTKRSVDPEVCSSLSSFFCEVWVFLFRWNPRTCCRRLVSSRRFWSFLILISFLARMP